MESLGTGRFRASRSLPGGRIAHRGRVGSVARIGAIRRQGAKAATPEAATPKAGTASKQTRTDHVRELQRALITAGYDPGPADGIFGPRTKAALQQYVAVPPPQVPGPADKTIAQFRTGEQRQGQ